MIDKALLRRVAQRTMEWPFRLRGFGEGIALRGLLATYAATGESEYLGYVHGLTRAYLGSGVARSPEDHVAPSREFLEIYQHTGDREILEACFRLAALHRSFPVNQYQARSHRYDQPGWSKQIWVDCMDVDPPFLTLLARVSQRGEFLKQGVQELLAYSRLLQDANSGLFWHGYEDSCGHNGQLWARGNGWALLGLVESLNEIPPETEGYEELHRTLLRLAEALAKFQNGDGLWHTLVKDSSSYVETSLAAMVSYAFRLAYSHSLLNRGRFEAVSDRAAAAVLRHVDGSGALQLVSSATPIGEARMYATRSFGTFPWGQGPLLLMLTQENYEDHQS
jgi:unsaturated rhamnogalacturonyl hydrolase